MEEAGSEGRMERRGGEEPVATGYGAARRQVARSAIGLDGSIGEAISRGRRCSRTDLAIEIQGDLP